MRHRLDRVRANGDDGAILLLTLAFLLLFGLFIAALLGQTSSSLSTTGVVRDRSVTTYNTDAGVDYGIMRVRQDGTLCPNAAAGTQNVTAEIGGTLAVHPSTPGVTVTCQTIEGSSIGANGYAAMILSSDADALATANGGAKRIEGPIYVEGGFDLKKPLIVDGDVDVDKKNSCSPTAVPAGLTVTPPGRWTCAAARPALPDHVLPAYPTTTQSENGTLIPATGSCNVFKPGLYKKAPVLKARNYFASGVYVFRDINTWDIKQADVYGGAQAGENVAVTSGAPCATDTDAGATGNGTGVQFIFEGNSRLDFDTQSRMELFSRQPAAPDGTPGISIYAVADDAPAPWKPFSGNPSIMTVQNGTSPEAAFHGLIYAPTATVTLFATNSVVAQSLAGLVANKVLLISTPNSTGLSIAGKKGKGKRVTVIRASAPSTSGGQPAVSQAVVEYPNDDVTVQVVRSRRVVG